ncbi:hypothetical protein [Enterococcus malodoratus]|uniref:Uncharacterized protein n=1 Tax=Enterococcus malodoratus ATCC 43197 TaxID=1158601 RepID=R2RKZ4_9ENTE|nr:hypothetical protein [Enterococcus malodoratus]BBM18292.1 hypothetical protein G15_1957 [Enterococcus avium]EOH81296.1 hypothetical protein UAI_00406 [Enterococcus malodoratus ATCC 43197]EOT68879.1 hypothetical protein I585_00338 [Enterococcus malodoratus ATCC 43197]OJG58803.1 hypothetical protein RV07_GL002805 [Enterococcus malodoratus]SET83417.1 hypothetical protein SAMN04487821_12456 [Enterococcus malodoratus]
MMILILFIVFISGLVVFKQWKNYQSNLAYWERINQYEERRKKEILTIALKNQRLLKGK